MRETLLPIGAAADRAPKVTIESKAATVPQRPVGLHLVSATADTR
jgi:hypothetical protein